MASKDESPGCSSESEDSGMSSTPVTNEKIKTEKTKAKKTPLLVKFFQRKWTNVKRGVFEKAGLSTQSEEGPSSIPGANCAETQNQLKTELSMLEEHAPPSLMQLLDVLAECKLSWTPVTEVWLRVFIGNGETALDQATLEKMGITHVLNATPAEDAPGRNIPSREAYYQSLNISYYHVAAVDEAWFDISEFFHPAAGFIQTALQNPEHKVLINCAHGVSCSASLSLAYLMIHLDLLLENAIDRVTRVRRIEPNIGFLKQLALLNANLIEQRKLKLENLIKGH
ncbi:hypothetical protein DNTS_013670 [Danionella cerebrum]|uniref:Tyrosine-protein phosphatase domain-containing protein n=1 Tax=Danionella cerebrum TaxID=2873325 RepID=A0A553N4H4_9TELE|nr:hypothetical protein DNTS_013670 [Danionella translucida]